VDHSGRFIRKKSGGESFLTPVDEEIANVDSAGNRNSVKVRTLKKDIATVQVAGMRCITICDVRCECGMVQCSGLYRLTVSVCGILERQE
jgi:hypothetical protein